jgi:phosphoribosylanthranilate isomerase
MVKNLLKIKICGLKDKDNIRDLITLQPDFMGFILHSGSPRNVRPDQLKDLTTDIPQTISKVGVLVNEPIESALNIVKTNFFDILQLHGNEDPQYCKILSRHIDLIKTFSVTDTLPANIKDYTRFCKLFLFDTKGENYGGTGKQFDHNLLSVYSLKTRFILSGGISPDDDIYLKKLNLNNLEVIDLNSRFEIKPGIKNVELLKAFINKIRRNDITD